VRKSLSLLAAVAATSLGLAAPQALAAPATPVSAAAAQTTERHPGAAVGADAVQRFAAAARGRAAGTPAAARARSYTTLVSRLDNPRQLSVDRAGQLYVAEAGHGAASPRGCVGTGEERFCAGTTGRISRIDRTWTDRAIRRTVVSGLPSAAGPDGSFAGGAAGVSARGGRLDIAVGDVPELTPQQFQGRAAALLRARPGGRPVKVADLLAYELKANPDGQRQFNDKGEPLDALSNPYAALALPGRTLVADAGANAIIQVSANGRISTFAALPNITTGPCAGAPNNDPQHPGCDSVPTAITLAPDGYVYVAGLGGDLPGTARVWKLHPRTGKIVKTIGNLTAAHGIVVGRAGTVYVSELLYGFDPTNPNLDPSTVGRITRIARNGSRSYVQVPLPAGLALIGGRLYAAAWSVAPATGAFGNPAWSGQLVRIRGPFRR
jgi:hypothetical protein